MVLSDFPTLQQIFHSHEVQRFQTAKTQLEASLWARFHTEIKAAITSFPRWFISVVFLVISVLIILQLSHFLKFLLDTALSKCRSRQLSKHYSTRQQHVQECFACGHFQWVSNTIFPHPSLLPTNRPNDTPNLNQLACFSATPQGFKPVSLHNPRCSLIVSKASRLLADEQMILYHPQNDAQQAQSDLLHSKLDQSYAQFLSTLNNTTSFTPPFDFTVPFVCCREDCQQLNGDINWEALPAQIRALQQSTPQPSAVAVPQLPQSPIKQQVMTKIYQPNRALSLLPPQAPQLCVACIDDQQYRLSQKLKREKIWYQEQVRSFLKKYLAQNPLRSDPVIRDQIHTHLKRRHISLREIIPKIDEDIDDLIEMIDLPIWLLPPPPLQISPSNHPQHASDEDHSVDEGRSLDFSSDFALCRKCEEALQKFNLSMIAFTRQAQELNKSMQRTTSTSNKNCPTFNSDSPIVLRTLSAQPSSTQFPSIPSPLNAPVLSQTNSSTPLITPLRRKRLERGLDNLLPVRQLGHLQSQQLPRNGGQQQSALARTTSNQQQPQHPPPSNSPPRDHTNHSNTSHERERRRDIPRPPDDNLESPLSLDTAQSTHLSTTTSSQHNTTLPTHHEEQPEPTPSTATPQTQQTFHNSRLYHIQFPVLSQFSLLNRLLFHLALLFTTLLLEPLRLVTFLTIYPIVLFFREISPYFQSSSSPHQPLTTSSRPLDSPLEESNMLYNPTQSTLPTNKQHIPTQRASYLIQYHSVLSIIAEYRKANNDPIPDQDLTPHTVNQLFQRHNYINEWNGYEQPPTLPSQRFYSSNTPTLSSPLQSPHHNTQSIPLQSEPSAKPSNPQRIYVEMIKSSFGTFNIISRALNQAQSASKFTALLYYAFVFVLTMGTSVLFHTVTDTTPTTTTLSETLQLVQSYLPNVLNIQPELVQQFFNQNSREELFYYCAFKLISTTLILLSLLISLLSVTVLTQILLSASDSILLAAVAITSVTLTQLGIFVRFLTRKVKTTFKSVFQLFHTFFHYCTHYQSPPMTRTTVIAQIDDILADCPSHYYSPRLSQTASSHPPTASLYLVDDSIESLSVSSNELGSSPESSSQQTPLITSSQSTPQINNNTIQPIRPIQPPASIATQPIFNIPTQPQHQAQTQNHHHHHDQQQQQSQPHLQQQWSITEQQQQQQQQQQIESQANFPNLFQTFSASTHLTHKQSQNTPNFHPPTVLNQSFNHPQSSQSSQSYQFPQANSNTNTIPDSNLTGLNFEMYGLELSADAGLQLPMDNLSISHHTLTQLPRHKQYYNTSTFVENPRRFGQTTATNVPQSPFSSQLNQHHHQQQTSVTHNIMGDF